MAIERFEGGLVTLARSGLQDVLDIYDIEKAQREKAQLLGVPQSLLRDEQAVKKLRDARAEAVQAAKQREAEMSMNEKVTPKVIEGAMKGQAG